MVDKVKQKLRSRSNSRSSLNSPATHSNRNSTDIPDVPKISDRDRDRNAAYPSSPTSRQEAFPRASLENSAFHVSRGHGGRASTDSNVARKPLANTNSNLNPNSPSTAQHRANHSLGGQQSAFDEAIPNRGSSRHAAEQDYGQGYDSRRSVEERIPQRESSRYADTSSSPRNYDRLSNEYDASSDPNSPTQRGNRRVSIPERLAHNPPVDQGSTKPLPQVPAAHASGNAANNYDNITQPTAAYNSGNAPHYDRAYNSGNMSQQDADFNAISSRNDPMSNSAWMSPMISKGHHRQSSSSAPRDVEADAKYEAMARGHLRLPEGFNLQNTEHTHVYETQRPAVTHETIVKKRTEIIREEITRDIHMHHYYTYQQPIKLVEILPPKHYFLDLETGVRTEIAPPFGWSLPVSMFPVSPNTSQLAGYTRHYLVNDQHPYGIPEEAPLESAVNNQRHDGMARAL